MEAVAWVDERLAEASVVRSGEVEHERLRPWGTVLKVPTRAGHFWFKAAGPGTAFEVPLYELLVRTVPTRVLHPIAADPVRAWVLLPDGGLPIGQRLAGDELARVLTSALVQYGEMQRTLSPAVDALLQVGVADMRPEKMPARFDEALSATASLIERRDNASHREMHARASALAPKVLSWCERLKASPLCASLDHNDLHTGNILGSESEVRFYDWGDSVVAHPFASMLVPLGQISRVLRVDIDDARFEYTRDAYLEGFTTIAPLADLIETLEIACRVAKIARVLTWNRAIRAAFERGDPLDDEWVMAPIETLASLLDDSYIGGA